jgi:hypothetical protein
MNSKRWIAAAVLAVAVWPAQAAGTWAGPKPTEADKLARFTPVARAAWPGSRCAGRERVRLDDDVYIDEHEWQIDGVIAYASTWDPADDCRVGIRRGLPSDVFCGALVHEFGHLAGMDHSENPHSVMYPRLVISRACSQVVNAPTEEALALRILDRPSVWWVAVVTAGGTLCDDDVDADTRIAWEATSADHRLEHARIQTQKREKDMSLLRDTLLPIRLAMARKPNHVSRSGMAAAVQGELMRPLTQEERKLL